MKNINSRLNKWISFVASLITIYVFLFSYYEGTTDAPNVSTSKFNNKNIDKKSSVLGVNLSGSTAYPHSKCELNSVGMVNNRFDPSGRLTYCDQLVDELEKASGCKIALVSIDAEETMGAITEYGLNERYVDQRVIVQPEFLDNCNSAIQTTIRSRRRYFPEIRHSSYNDATDKLQQRIIEITFGS